MKRIIEVTDKSEVGLEAMLGEQVLLMCGNYFYAGKLTGVNADHVELTDASIVYETGEWSSKGYKDAQRLPGIWRVQKAALESWGQGK